MAAPAAVVVVELGWKSPQNLNWGPGDPGGRFVGAPVAAPGDPPNTNAEGAPSAGPPNTRQPALRPAAAAAAGLLGAGAAGGRGDDGEERPWWGLLLVLLGGDRSRPGEKVGAGEIVAF